MEIFRCQVSVCNKAEKFAGTPPKENFSCESVVWFSIIVSLTAAIAQRHQQSVKRRASSSFASTTTGRARLLRRVCVQHTAAGFYDYTRPVHHLPKIIHILPLLEQLAEKSGQKSSVDTTRNLEAKTGILKNFESYFKLKTRNSGQSGQVDCFLSIFNQIF